MTSWAKYKVFINLTSDLTLSMFKITCLDKHDLRLLCIIWGFNDVTKSTKSLLNMPIRLSGEQRSISMLYQDKEEHKPTDDGDTQGCL